MRSFVIFFIMSFVYSLQAKTIFIEFLNTAIQNTNLLEIKKEQKMVSENEFNQIPLEKVRINMSYSKFNEKNIDDEYAIRVYPKTFAQKTTEEKIYNLSKNRLDIMYQDAQQKALKMHYYLFLDTYFQYRYYNHLQEVAELNKKRVDMAIDTASTTSDIVDLFKLKHKMNSSDFTLLEQKKSYYSALSYMQRYLPNITIQEINEAFENISLLEAKELALFVNKYKNNFFESIEQSLKREKIAIQLAKERMKLNKLNSSLRINSLDIEYENRDTFKNSLSIGINIEYAWPNHNSLTSISDKLRLISAKNELLATKERINYQISKLIREINSLNSNLIHAKNSINQNNFYSTYKNLKNSDAFVLFDLQNMHLKIKENIIKIEEELYHKFIDFLYINKALTSDILFKKEVS